MIRILAVHNRDMLNATFKTKFRKAKPLFQQYQSSWSIEVIKLGEKPRKSKYDRVYFDEDTITITQLFPYINKYVDEATNVFPINIENAPKKLKCCFVTEIKKLRKHNN